MKLIKPIVGISKIIDTYDTVICGFNGVLSKGNNINLEAVNALTHAYESGKQIAIVSNSPQRVKNLVDLMLQSSVDLSFLTSVISAGELLHYKLKSDGLGKKYYNLGDVASAQGVFSGLDYVEVRQIGEADFVFAGLPKENLTTIENYGDDLQHAVALGLPLVCVGNDVSTYVDGEVSLAGGAIAEQYAVLGGQIITLGKPDKGFLAYVMESFRGDNLKTLLIGDSFSTDIKSGQIIGADTLLISKGIHVNFLGEGYIPDVEKTRNLAMNFDAYPDYVISGLRW